MQDRRRATLFTAVVLSIAAPGIADVLCPRVTSEHVADTTDLGRWQFEWGEVRVFCRPGLPADLLINGRQVDRQTPYSDKLGVGTHRFEVRKAGFRIYDVVVTDGAGNETRPSKRADGSVDVEIRAGQETRIQFVIQKETP